MQIVLPWLFINLSEKPTIAITIDGKGPNNKYDAISTANPVLIDKFLKTTIHDSVIAVKSIKKEIPIKLFGTSSTMYPLYTDKTNKAIVKT